MLFSPFLIPGYLGIWGLSRHHYPKWGAEPSKYCSGKRTLACGETLGGLVLYRYRLLLSEAGNVLDTQLGIALLREKTVVVKPDSWHTQGNSQLFVGVTLFVLMLWACW